MLDKLKDFFSKSTKSYGALLGDGNEVAIMFLENVSEGEALSTIAELEACYRIAWPALHSCYWSLKMDTPYLVDIVFSNNYPIRYANGTAIINRPVDLALVLFDVIRTEGLGLDQNTSHIGDVGAKRLLRQLGIDSYKVFRGPLEENNDDD